MFVLQSSITHLAAPAAPSDIAQERKSRAGVKAVDFWAYWSSAWAPDPRRASHAPLLCRAQASLNKFSWDYLVAASHCSRVECSHPWWKGLSCPNSVQSQSGRSCTIMSSFVLAWKALSCVNSESCWNVWDAHSHHRVSRREHVPTLQPSHCHIPVAKAKF